MKKTLLLAGLMTATSITVLAQDRTRVTGVVKDDKGEPLMGVQVIPVGHTAAGTVTDLDGKYTVMVPKGAKELSFTYIGYAKQTVTLGGQTTFNITMREETSALSEVVVTGYSTQNRRTMTTSIAKLDNKVLESASRSNAATSLQGTIPGLRVTQTTGTPGATPSIVLRGGLTFSSEGSAPLILIDGVPGSFYGLNSDDIESMEVLKDAASTAIYGARAANGVILVTTKKGKSGRSSVNFRSKISFNTRPTNKQEYLGAEDYIRMNRIGVANTRMVRNDPNMYGAFLTGAHGAATGNTSFNSVYTTQYLTDANKYLLDKPGWATMVDPLDGTKTILYQVQSNDFSELFLQNSGAEDISLSFDGGNDKGSYYLGLGMLNDKGMVINSGFKRYSATFNGSYNITPKLKASSSVMYLYSSTQSPFESVTDLFRRVQGMAPTTRLYYTNDDGTDTTNPFPGTYSGFANPQYYADKFERDNLEQRISGNVQLDYKITDKLTATLKGGHLMISNDAEVFVHAYQNGIAAAMNTDRVSSYSRSRNQTNQFTALLNYRNTFAKKHSLSALAGFEYLHNKLFTVSAATRKAPTDLIATMAGSESNGVPASAKTEYAIASILGQVNYDYDMRYLVGLTFRYDGTSRLMNDKWGFFPGISLGWNVHNESFYKGSKLSKYLNSIKPRISYGVNGNIDALGNYTVQGLYAASGIYNGNKGYYNTELLNAGLRWERSTTLNFGLDLGAFNNRVTLMADYFVRNVYDKISGLTLPTYLGITSVQTNNGTLQNRGFELQINADVIKTKDFTWNVGFNYTKVRSYAVSLPNNGVDKNRIGGHEVYDPASGKDIYIGGIQEGERLGWDLIVGYVHDGVYKTQADLDEHAGRRVEFAATKDKQFLGDTRWKDLNGDNVINSKDRVAFGRSTPDFTGGFNTSVSYKGFSLYLKTDFAVGHKLYNGMRLVGITQTQGNQSGYTEILDTWSPTNSNSNLARYDFTDQQNNHSAGARVFFGASAAGSSSYFLEKGDYLAFRELTLSYTHSKPLFKGFIKSARVYATGTNLFYLTGFTGNIPEASTNVDDNTNAVDAGRYPIPQTFTFGLNLTF